MTTTKPRYWRPRLSANEPDLVGTMRAVRNVNPHGKPKIEVDVEITDPAPGPVGEIRTVELSKRNLRQAFAGARPKIGTTIRVARNGASFNDHHARNRSDFRIKLIFKVEVLDGEIYDEELSITRWTKLTQEDTDA